MSFTTKKRKAQSPSVGILIGFLVPAFAFAVAFSAVDFDSGIAAPPLFAERISFDAETKTARRFLRIIHSAVAFPLKTKEAAVVVL